jgi:hypothetical protein
VATILGIFGPSVVRVLPLAAGINEGGHYFAYIILFLVFLLPPLFKTTEGVVVGFQIFAWAPKKDNKNSEKKIKFRPPPPGPLGAIFSFFLVYFLKILEGGQFEY